MSVVIRRAGPMDRPALVQARVALWPDGTAEQHDADVMEILSGHAPGTLPLEILIAESDGAFAGFIEVGLRSHADGCDTRRPVAFIEGWYVAPQDRRRGIGGALMAAAEDWGRAHGCLEAASDTWIDHDVSQRAHEALGFIVVDRCVHYRKSL